MNNLEERFYNLKELTQIDKLKYLGYRQLIKRVKIVSNKYQGNKELIYKKSNQWYIHSTLKEEFMKVKLPIDYKQFVTIACKNNLPVAYWKIIVFQLKKELKKVDTSTRIKYTIETTKNNIKHLHFITSFANLNKLNDIIKNNTLTGNSNEMNTKILKITDLDNLHKYLRKENIPVLLK